jgi:hypothetical protein
LLSGGPFSHRLFSAAVFYVPLSTAVPATDKKPSHLSAFSFLPVFAPPQVLSGTSLVSEKLSVALRRSVQLAFSRSAEYSIKGSSASLVRQHAGAGFRFESTLRKLMFFLFRSPDFPFRWTLRSSVPKVPVPNARNLNPSGRRPVLV